jgi:TPR repeat protein
VFPAAETRIAPPTVAPPPSPAVSDREEIAALLVRGRAYIAEGDVAAARLVLRRAVERGDPQAALALGGTYDPLVLKRLGVISFVADPEQARNWYRKAAELGSADATVRLEQLAQVER